MSEIKTNKISSLASNNDITLDPDGTGDVVVASGNLGIGTSSPSAKIHLNESGSANAVQRIQAGTNGYAAQLHLYGNNVSGASYNSVASYVNGDGTPQWEITGPEASAEDHMLLHTGGSERLRIDSIGRMIFATGGSVIQSAKISANYDSNSGPGICLQDTTPQNGNTFIRFINAGTTAGQITSNGGSSTTYATSSDQRLKENVVDMTGAIDRVKALAPKRFNFIADADTTVDGFLAHEAQAVVPEAVTGTHNEVETWTQQQIDDGDAPDGTSAGDNKLDGDGNTIPVMQGIDQSKLVPLLTAALKESIAKIEALETRVTALENA